VLGNPLRSAPEAARFLAATVSQEVLYLASASQGRLGHVRP
jgi:hypothetical protein